MKYIYAKFVNYIGFYLGMDLNIVEIDFTKCKTNLILIVGKNGSGKSTLENHLNPFPDFSGSFIEGKTAEKYLSLVDISGDRFDIHLISEVDSKGTRKTTKGFIQKNGIELNPNGNISSYKEILFSEFELDSNYNSLSMLSSIDRGMGDKTPSERKKFISSIMENLEVYNNIYKTLNKKSLIFKSHIGTLHTKIQNIGDRTSLELNLKNLKNQETIILQNIMDCRDKISSLKTKCNINEDKAEEYKELKSSLKKLNENKEIHLIELKKLKSTYKLNDKSIDKKYNSDKALLDSYIEKDKLYNNSLNDISVKLNNSYSRQRDIKSKLEGMNLNLDETLYEEFNNISEELNKYEESKNKYNSKNNNDIFKINVLNYSNDDYYGLRNIYNGLIELKKYIDSLYDKLSDNNYINYFNYSGDITKVVENLNDNLININNEINETNRLISLSEILYKKPESCKNKNCPFIKEAVEAKSKIKDSNFTYILDKKEKETEKINNELNQLNEIEIELNNFISYLNRMIPDKFELLLKYNNINIEDIIIEILNGISERYSFNNLIDYIENYKILSNTTKLYLSLKENYNNLKIKIDSQKEIEKISKEYKDILKDVSIEINNLTNDKIELENKISSNTNLIENLKSIIPVEEKYVNISNNLILIDNEISIITKKINEYSINIDNNEKMIEEIYNLNDNISKYTESLNPIQSDISNITGQLALINSYYEEYNEYNTKYRTIETIKKYCSPTGGGIQTLFMELYMSKTLELSNEILKMLFDGQYMLTNFVINEKEFRIPFLNNGMVVDDISNGSMSQVCMMGMIINLVLLYQGSSKFNIPRLDEPDASLDSRNRSLFMNVLWNCKNIFNIDQLFIISHSIEEDMSNCDVILFKTYDNYDLGSTYSANVIWNYNDIN